MILSYAIEEGFLPPSIPMIWLIVIVDRIPKAVGVAVFFARALLLFLELMLGGFIR